MPEIKLNSDKVQYSVHFSEQRKTIGIAIDKQSGITVRAPIGTQNEEILQVLL